LCLTFAIATANYFPINHPIIAVLVNWINDAPYTHQNYTGATMPTTQTKQLPATLPLSGYIRVNALIKIIPFSTSTIWRKSKSGDFPKPIKLSEQVTAWRVEDVRAWMQAKDLEAVNHGQ
jgi:prophage regulatory protein